MGPWEQGLTQGRGGAEKGPGGFVQLRQVTCILFGQLWRFTRDPFPLPRLELALSSKPGGSEERVVPVDKNDSLLRVLLQVTHGN